jgi:pyruvate dehydrogenase E2 component (dihydrolipoamide acetyltransferase)
LTEFKIPELGENVASGDVTRILVNVGDTIARDQPVLELETDKATIEVPSSVAGLVKEIKVSKGDTVNVGAVVLTVDDSAAGNGGAGKEKAEAGAREEEPATAAEPQRSAPSPAESQGEPAAAAHVDAGEASSSRHTDARSASTSAESPKVLSMPPRASAESSTASVRASAEPAPAAAASPAVRRLAREIGVDVADVQGTGPGGRISQEDVKEHARRILSSVGAATGAAAGGPRAGRPLPNFEKWGAVERQPWSNIRRSTSEHLSFAWNTVAHVTQCDKADVTDLEALRQSHRDQIASAGGALTVTAILVKVLATAVREFPQFNASLDVDRGEIVYKQYVNVGVAVDTERGLLVPVIRDADRKNILQISVELQQLSEKARNRKLTLEDMSGGGITISNLGGIGGTYFTPIVNWPEVAILGVSRGVREPVWRNGGVEPRMMLPMSLSYDHRLIDGADAMRFLRWIVQAIEQPFLLSLVG